MTRAGRWWWVPNAVTVAIAVFAAVIGQLLLPHPPTPPDASIYLAVGHSFADSWELVTPDGALMAVRPPAYPLVLGAAIRVLGDPLGPEMLRLVLMGAAGALLFRIAMRWYGVTVGVVAAVLVFTSVRMVDFLASFNIDLLWFVVALTTILLFDRVQESRTVPDAIAAGAALGVAVLVKEASLVLAAVPILVASIRPGPQPGPRLRALFVAYGVAGLVLVPWLAIFARVEGRGYLVGAGGAVAWIMTVLVVTVAALAVVSGSSRRSRRVIDRVAVRAVARLDVRLLIVAVIVGALAVVYAGILAGIRVDDPAHTNPVRALVEGSRDEYAPLIGGSLLALVLTAASVAAMVVAAVRGRRAALDHLCYVAIFVPLFVMILMNGYAGSLRNVIPGAALWLVAIAWFVVSVVRHLVAWMRPSPVDGRTPRVTVWKTVTGGVVLVALGLGTGAWAVQRTEQVVDASVREDEVLDWDVVARDVAGWLDTHAGDDAVVMAGWIDWARLRRFSESELVVHQAPLTRVRVAPTGPLFEAYDPPYAVGYFGAYDVDDHGEDWVLARRHHRAGYFTALSQSALLEALDESGARYLVISGEHSALGTIDLEAVLDAMPGFERRYVAAAGRDRSVVYEVGDHAVQALPAPPLLVNASTYDALLDDLGAVRGLSPTEAAQLLCEARIRIVGDGQAADEPRADLRQLAPSC